MATQEVPDGAAVWSPTPAWRPRGGWKIELGALVDRLEYILKWIESESPTTPGRSMLAHAIESHLQAARQQIPDRRRLPESRHAVILAHLDAAQADLLRMAPNAYVHGSLPSLVTHARKLLTAEDLRLIALERLASAVDSRSLTEDDREVVVACAAAINEEERRNRLHLENFKRVVVSTSMVLVVLTIAVGIVAGLKPDVLPLCFTSEVDRALNVACPTASTTLPASEVGDADDAIRATVSSQDIALILFLGVIGAALSSALAVRHHRESGEPFTVVMPLTFLKLATGALIALFGMILIRAGLVPGLDSLDSTPEIIAWALVLGYSQQLFTGVIDRRAEAVLLEAGAAQSSPGGRPGG